MLDVILFFAASAGGILFLWRPNGTSTGPSRIYRFLAFEALVGLALLTRERWFVDPISTPQLVSWILGAAGLGVALLAVARRPANREASGAVASEPEDAPTLPPARGIYRRVRHPFYGAALLLGWGLFAKGLALFDGASVLYALLLTGASLFLVSAARADETADYIRFGSPYALYVRSSKMLIPYIL